MKPEDRGTKHTSMAMEQVLLPLETVFAKEDKSRSALSWKAPRLSEKWVDKGLRYGLSGNRVPDAVTDRRKP